MPKPTLSVLIHGIAKDCAKDGVMTRELATEWANDTLMQLASDVESTRWLDNAIRKCYDAGVTDERDGNVETASDSERDPAIPASDTGGNEPGTGMVEGARKGTSGVADA